MIHELRKNSVKILLITFLLGFITNCAFPSDIQLFPPDTGITDTSKNVVIIYDTVKTQKIIYIYDTLVVFDTLYLPDTTDFKEKLFNVSMDFSGSLYFPIRKLHTDNPKFDDLILFKKNAEKIQPGYSFGGEINFYYKKWAISTGLAYTCYKEKSDIDIYNLTFNPDDTLIINNNSYWNVVVIDTFYQVFDSVLTPVIVADSNWVVDLDSNLISRYDTIINKQNYAGKNVYKYIEVPLIIGNEIYSNGRYSVFASLGLISSFLIKVSGKTIIPPDEFNIVLLEDSPLI
ncbi:MAG: hypothetical protein ABIJ97_10355, partial [Bacteroidota bacterium]